MLYNIVIIGAGASGLMAAIAAARSGASVLIIERQNQAGKKLLVTGNGKCNLTNAGIDREKICQLIRKEQVYRGKDPVFAGKVLSMFDWKDTCSIFRAMGLMTAEKGDLIYPASMQAVSVQNALRWKLAEYKNVDVLTDCTAGSVSVSEDGIFCVKTDKGRIRCEKLIIAAGSHAGIIQDTDNKKGRKKGSPASDDKRKADGYSLCKSLGHPVLPVRPALCALRCRESYFRSLAGVRIHAGIKLMAGSKVLSEDIGELQLTDYGISGIPVFQVSRYATADDTGRLRENLTAELDLMPEHSEKDIYDFIHDSLSSNPSYNIRMILSGILNKKLADVTSDAAGFKADHPAGRMGDNAVRALAKKIKYFRVSIIGTADFGKAQVCAGGCDTDCIDPEDMSSKIVKGLYITGELLDIDGICGGYNLQWAWATGYLAGSAAGKRVLMGK